MDTTASEIVFDDAGVCNFCTQWQEMEKKRKSEQTEWPWVLDQIRKDGRGKEYDVLLGLSGGVDSSTCLHYLIENGLRPLTFSIDNGWNTKQADENIMRLVEGLKVPFFRYVLDLEKFRELQIAFVKSGTANAEIPTDHVLMAATYQTAAKYGIKWIISGGNVASEGIMPASWGYQPRDLHFIKSVYRTYYPKGSLKTLPTIGILGYLWYRFVKGIKVVNLLDNYNYNKFEAINLLIAKYGWQPYGEKHEENRFTKWFQNFYLPVLHGIDKRKAHYSSLINARLINKDMAMNALTVPLTSERLEFQDSMPENPKDYTEFKNSEWLWNLLSNIYARIK